MDDEEVIAKIMEAQSKSMVAVYGKDLEKYQKTMVPIKDLAAGNRVRWKDAEYKTSMFPRVGEIVEVFRVLSRGELNSITRSPHDGNLFAAQYDFVVLFRHTDGELYEFPFDSRRFERV